MVAQAVVCRCEKLGRKPQAANISIRTHRLRSKTMLLQGLLLLKLLPNPFDNLDLAELACRARRKPMLVLPIAPRWKPAQPFCSHMQQAFSTCNPEVFRSVWRRLYPGEAGARHFADSKKTQGLSSWPILNNAQPAPKHDTPLMSFRITAWAAEIHHVPCLL